MSEDHSRETADQRLRAELAAALAHPWVRRVLANLPLPGGLTVTEQAAGWAGVNAASRVLDASRRGRSGLFLARAFGCAVVTVTPESDDVAAAREEARRQRLAHLVTVEEGSLADLPKGLPGFDAAFLECALSSFPDQAAVLRRVISALTSWGTLVLSDVTAEGDLPGNVADLLRGAGIMGHVATMEEYLAAVSAEGLLPEVVEPIPHALPALLRDLRGKLAGAELPVSLGLLPISPRLFTHIKDLLTTGVHMADEGVIRFFVMAARRSG